MKSKVPERAAARIGTALQIKTADKIKIGNMIRKVNAYTCLPARMLRSTIPESRG